MPQRLRVTYRKHGPARYVAHLDLMRTWERAIRRTRLPLSYSQGFTPHARLQLAAPLPVGTAGERELLDFWLDEESPPDEVARRLTVQLPSGLEVVSVEEVPERLPALQAATAGATYEAHFALADIDLARLRQAVEEFLALEALPWTESRGERTRQYDLRRAILGLAVREEPESAVLEVQVSMRDGGSARPSSVLAALGFGDVEPQLVARTHLEIADHAIQGASDAGEEPPAEDASEV